MKKILIPISLLLLALFLPELVGRNPYFTGIMINVLMMASLASAWNIPGGYAGQFSFGHAAYFGAGAYTTLILLSGNPIDPLLALLAGVVTASLIALITGSIVFRLRGHYFALASIAVAEIVRLSVLNLQFTGGAQGILLSDLTFHGIDLNSKIPFYYGMLMILVLSMGTTAYIQSSRMGYYLQAIREDQDAAASLGINVALYKNRALLVSAALSSVTGSLYGLYIRFIDPGAVLDLRLSIEIILTAIIGGVGTIWGPVLGAILLVPLAELLRSNVIGDTLISMGIVSDVSPVGHFFKEGLAHAHVLVYGVITVVCILFMPQGVLGITRRRK
ncbi:MAG: branched-chain amino acid ABC transporter permease [Chlorobiaceae bacterium]|nr:branched-chain amino acid ABC transporter permease [Chlorobiaceae bacterium]